MTDRKHPNMLYSRQAIIEGMFVVLGVAALADLAMTRATAEAQRSATPRFFSHSVEDPRRPDHSRG